MSSSADAVSAMALSVAAEATSRMLRGAGESAAERALDAVTLTAEGRDHLGHVAAAMSVARPLLLAAYVAWCRSVTRSDGTHADAVDHHLRTLVDVIGDRDPGLADRVRDYVEDALATDPSPHLAAPPAPADPRLAELARTYTEALLHWDRDRALGQILAAAESGTSLADLYLSVLAPSLREVGRRWQRGELGVGQEHMVSAATEVVMTRLTALAGPATTRRGRTAVVACVGDELHAIGARMVADLLAAAGWDTCFVGANTPTAAIVDTVRRTHADVAAISTMRTVRLPETSRVVAQLRVATDARVLVGGAPFTLVEDLWERIGAHATAPDAAAAVVRADALVAGGART